MVGHVCLTDFGLAKEVEKEDQAHTFSGTPEYLAPEIVQGEFIEVIGHSRSRGVAPVVAATSTNITSQVAFANPDDYFKLKHFCEEASLRYCLTWQTWFPAGMSTSVAAAFLDSFTLSIIHAFFNTYSCCARWDHGAHSWFHCKQTIVVGKTISKPW